MRAFATFGLVILSLGLASLAPPASAAEGLALAGPGTFTDARGCVATIPLEVIGVSHTTNFWIFDVGGPFVRADLAGCAGLSLNHLYQGTWDPAVGGCVAGANNPGRLCVGPLSAAGSALVSFCITTSLTADCGGGTLTGVRA